ncbi:hypothetical protein F2Q69_00016682, partial [Brassica cretica]
QQQALSRRKPPPSSSPPPSSDSPLRTPSARKAIPEFPFYQQNWFIALLFLMALGFFCLALFLYLSLDPDSGYTPASAAPSGQQQALSRRKPPPSSSPPPSSDSPLRTPSARKAIPEFPFYQQNWFIALLFLMALGFFCLALFLYLSLDPDSGYTPASAAPSGKEGVEIVKPVPGKTFKQGDAIKNGATIRLQHMKTRKWLHSHLHASPISGNLEVSCFGDDSNSDTGDHWKLTIEGSGKIWKQDQRVRLQHIDTSGYLHSHDKKYQRIAGGQQEVCGIREKRADNVWLAAEGVYLPVNESSK